MSATVLYDTRVWRDYSKRVRADAQCALAHLAGGCRGALQTHHVEPISEGGEVFPDENGVVVLCAAHHAWLHAWRRRKDKAQQRKRCPHTHRSAEAREQCERRLNQAA